MVAILGPDGAGKSTVIAAIADRAQKEGRQVKQFHLSPRLFRRRENWNPTTEPHNQRPRSLLGSTAKLAYWMIDYCVGYVFKVVPARIRDTLVLFDRYFMDIFVDPKRYRYAGPAWLPRALWSFIPKPDIVILLDAPAEVLHQRKQEVPLVETRRQVQAYRELVGSMPNGYIVDASQPLDDVVASVHAIMIGFLDQRMQMQNDGAYRQ